MCIDIEPSTTYTGENKNATPLKIFQRIVVLLLYLVTTLWLKIWTKRERENKFHLPTFINRNINILKSWNGFVCKNVYKLRCDYNSRFIMRLGGMINEYLNYHIKNVNNHKKEWIALEKSKGNINKIKTSFTRYNEKRASIISIIWKRDIPGLSFILSCLIV